MTAVPYDVGYWNGGQRSRVALWTAWGNLMRGEFTPEPLRVLGVSEVADRLDALAKMERLGYGVVLGPDGVPDGRKEAIIYDPGALDPLGEPELVKVGDAFQGRRHGRPGRVRMANKYVLAQEFRDKATGWTPTHGVTHVWPSVTLQKPQVRELVGNIADWCEETRGSLFLTADWNMEPSHDLMAAMRRLDLVCSQRLDGRPEATFGRRPIDHIYARESGHYEAVEQITVRLPGREGNGKRGHKAVVLRGRMSVKHRK